MRLVADTVTCINVQLAFQQTNPSVDDEIQPDHSPVDVWRTQDDSVTKCENQYDTVEAVVEEGSP
jgi:hypothetical protein